MNDALRAKVRDFVNDERFMAILDRLETTAVNKGVNADPGDDARRREAFADIRAIRALRSELKSLAEPANPPRNVAPA